MIRDVTQGMLEALGHDLELACHGEEAIGKYQGAFVSDNPFDLVLLDLDLTIKGGMGGEETLRHLLSIDPEALAIVSSGYSNNTSMVNHLSYGFKACLKKPYCLEDLRDALNAFLI